MKVPAWWSEMLVPMLMTFGAVGLVKLGIWIHDSTEEMVLYQTKDVLVVQLDRPMEGKMRVRFVGENPSAEDLAALAQVLDRGLIGNGEEVNRALLERLLATAVCPDGGVE